MKTAVEVLVVALLAICHGSRPTLLGSQRKQSGGIATDDKIALEARIAHNQTGLAGSFLQTGSSSVATWGHRHPTPSVEAKRAGILFIHKFLKDRNIEHVFYDGTSLGLHRDGDVIPADDDVDVMVNYTHLKSLEASMRTAAIVESRWHVMTIVKETPIDIYGFFSVPGGICITEDKKFWSSSLMWPPLYKTFPDISKDEGLPIPRDPDGYHSTYYGEHWRTPCHDHSCSPSEESFDVFWNEHCLDEYARLSGTGVDDRRLKPTWAVVVLIALIVGSAGVMIAAQSVRRFHLASFFCLCAFYIGLLFGCGYITNFTGNMAGEFGKPKMAVLEQVVQVQITLLIWWLFDGTFSELLGTLRRSSPDLLHFGGPAILYVLADVLLTFAYRYMDGVSADALMVLKVLPLAVVWQNVIGPRLRIVAWTGLALICTGCVAWLSRHLEPAMHLGTLSAPASGVSLLGSAALVLAAATLLHEWILKRQAEVLATSVQTLALSVLGLVSALVVWLIVEFTGLGGTESQFFDPGQWEFLLMLDRPRPWVQLYVFASAHVARAYVLKWTSTLAGDACGAASMILAAMISMPTFGSLFAGGVGIVNFISFTLVSIGIGLFMFDTYCTVPPIKAAGFLASAKRWSDARTSQNQG